MTNEDAAILIIRELRQHGHEALLAGGCVRDRLLGRPAKDYDVATSAEPAEVSALFHRTLEVGAQFGVVIVLMGKFQIEVATFRIDGSYVDGRRPAHVRYTTAQEDAVRRDFTVNGMFYDPVSHQVLDYVDGQSDLRGRIIRTIGSPQDRFGEDHLRMLRAVRFAAQLDFTIEPATFAAIQEGAERIEKVSGERVCMELQTLLTCPGCVLGVRLLWESGLAVVIFPAWTAVACDVAVRVLASLRKTVSLPLGLAALFAACDTETALGQCESLKLSRREFGHLRFLLEKRDALLASDLSRAQLRLLQAEPHFADLYRYQGALQRAHARPLDALVAVCRRLRVLKTLEIKPEPLLKGAALHRLGVTPGPRFGQCLEAVYWAQLEGQIETPEEARDLAQTWLAENDPPREEPA